MAASRIPIRPKVGMLSAFSRLNYRPWFAIAELVDNAIQSYVGSLDALRAAGGGSASLTVRIDVDEERISVSDNAAGIALADFPRAFMPAAPPPDRSGLSEYGLGMKAAACWFAQTWRVVTSALGEDVEREIRFDVPLIVERNIEDLDFEERPARTTDHRTSIILEKLHVIPRGRTRAKIKSHLASIYRMFLRRGDIAIYFNGEALSHTDPPVLTAPYYRTPQATPVPWRKEIDVSLDAQHRITGWAAIRERASISEAGFAVFRRDRLILGSGDDTYRPEMIFGKANSFTYQRLFGELFVEGFQVSHTKDGLHWEDWEELLLTEVSRQLDADPLPLLQQAEGHRQMRARHARSDWGTAAVEEAARAIETHAPPLIARQAASAPFLDAPPAALPEAPLHASRSVIFDIPEANRTWAVTISLANHDGQLDWYEFSRRVRPGDPRTTEIEIRINLDHPFSERFALHSEDGIEPLVRLAAGLVIAELTSIEADAGYGGRTLRRHLNELLRTVLSHA